MRHALAMLLLSSNPVDGVPNVPIDSDIRLRIDGEIDPDKLTPGMIHLRRLDDGKEIPGEYKYDPQSGELVFTPRFFFRLLNPVDPRRGIAWEGVRPNSTYRFSVGVPSSPAIESVVGRSDIKIDFSTVDLDYGFYWFGSNGQFEKHPVGKTSRFFDPAKATVIFLHGWQHSTSASDMWRENPYFSAGEYTGFNNTAELWRERGFNVGVFYWSQWADEDEVRDAQAKIWSGQNLFPTKDGKVANMRYRLRNGEHLPFTTLRSVADIFAAQYAQVFSNYTGGEIRIVGHSLGAELSIVATNKISERVLSGEFSSNMMPSRLVLLDSFFAKSSEGYLDGRTPGEICAEYVSDMITNHGIAVEMIKSSLLGGAVGDENPALRKMAAFYRISPLFIPSTQQTAHHTYAYVWYMGSIARKLPVNAGGFLGAAASGDEIRSLMNFGKGEPVHYGAVGVGNRTPSPIDDRFEVRVGVDPR